jgi:hypothetical protein
LPEHARIGARVVSDHRGERHPDQQAESAEQYHRQLQRSCGREPHGNEAREGGDQRDDACRPVAQVPAEIGAEREEARRGRDISHRLPEQCVGLIAGSGSGVSVADVLAHGILFFP